MNSCAVLVCSCDKYEDAWDPFFTLFEKFWDNCPYPIYLNTESKIYQGQGELAVKTLNCRSKQCTWSKRLRLALEQIDSPFVIIMLEDFFLLSNVRQDIVSKCLESMENDSSIATICFERLGKLGEQEPFNEIFVERVKGSKYRLNCQVGIWRKDILLKCLRDFESPWEFEEMGNIRSNGISEKFYFQIKDTEPVFDYKFQINEGYGLYRGKWLRSNAELFKAHGIEVDFEVLGFFGDKSKSKNKKRSVLEKLKFYSKHPSEIFKTIKAISIKNYKKIYWSIEKLKYKKYIPKS